MPVAKAKMLSTYICLQYHEMFQKITKSNSLYAIKLFCIYTEQSAYFCILEFLDKIRATMLATLVVLCTTSHKLI